MSRSMTFSYELSTLNDLSSTGRYACA
jgi:hypothetical protein